MRSVTTMRPDRYAEANVESPYGPSTCAIAANDSKIANPEGPYGPSTFAIVADDQKIVNPESPYGPSSFAIVVRIQWEELEQAIADADKSPEEIAWEIFGGV